MLLMTAVVTTALTLFLTLTAVREKTNEKNAWLFP